ncbi:MAG: hypothetical protein NUV65_00220 [Candidatus Roizmanbacteria bacterium]|nr:hypothetical protein [Candidatus Roizmanbacteria bacterium]
MLKDFYIGKMFNRFRQTPHEKDYSGARHTLHQQELPLSSGSQENVRQMIASLPQENVDFNIQLGGATGGACRHIVHVNEVGKVKQIYAVFPPETRRPTQHSQVARFEVDSSGNGAEYTVTARYSSAGWLAHMSLSDNNFAAPNSVQVDPRCSLRIQMDFSEPDALKLFRLHASRSPVQDEPEQDVDKHVPLILQLHERIIDHITGQISALNAAAAQQLKTQS